MNFQFLTAGTISVNSSIALHLHIRVLDADAYRREQDRWDILSFSAFDGYFDAAEDA